MKNSRISERSPENFINLEDSVRNLTTELQKQKGYSKVVEESYDNLKRMISEQAAEIHYSNSKIHSLNNEVNLLAIIQGTQHAATLPTYNVFHKIYSFWRFLNVIR